MISFHLHTLMLFQRSDLHYMKGTARRYLQTPSKFLFAQMQFLQYVEKVIRYICDLHLEEIQSKLFCFVHSIFGFWFLVTFVDEVMKVWNYENIKILHNLCLHFARQDGKDGKNGKKITQLKWPKYQKPKDKNMERTKQ